MIDMSAWILALIPTLFIFLNILTQSNGQVFRLWGLWLYILVVVGAVFIEILLMKASPVKTE